MDNLMSKVFLFLVRPESELSVAFLCIFAVLFIIGLYYIYSNVISIKAFNESAIEGYNTLRNNYTPDTFISSYEDKLNIKEYKIESLSNVFVSIGILGTFIGLGIAIQGATSLLSTDKVDLAQLNAVLSVIAFKFQTSVWGTLFSIIFQKVCYEPYFSWRQGIISEVKGKLYENETCLRTTVEKQYEKIEYMQQHFDTYVDSSIDFVNTTKSLHECVDGMHSDLDIYRKNITDTINENRRIIMETEQEVSKRYNDCVNDIKQTLVYIHEEIDKSQQAIREMHEGLWFRMERTIETLQKKFIRSEDMYVKDTQESFNKILMTSLDKVHKEYLNGAKSLDGVVAKLEGVLDGINATVSEIHSEFISEQLKLTGINKETFETISHTMRQVTELEEQHVLNMKSIYSEMENIFKNVESSNSNEITKIETVVAGFGNIIDKSLNEYKSQQQSNTMIFKSILENDKEFKACYEHRMKELIVSLIKQYEVSNERMAVTEAQIARLNDSILEQITNNSQASKDLSVTIDKICKENIKQNQLLQKMIKADSAQKTELGELMQSILDMHSKTNTIISSLLSNKDDNMHKSTSFDNVNEECVDIRECESNSSNEALLKKMNANFSCGEKYRLGKGTKIDLDKAKKFYMNAAEMGHKIAMERLKKFFD